MTVNVKLADIVDAFHIQNQECSHYLDTKTGQIILITDEDIREAKSDTPLDGYADWQQE